MTFRLGIDHVISRRSRQIHFVTMMMNKERFYNSGFRISNTTTGPSKRFNLTAVWYSVRSLILTKIDFVINQFRTNDMEISVALE